MGIAATPSAVPWTRSVSRRRVFGTGFQEETVRGLKLRIVHAYLGCGSLLALLMLVLGGGAGNHWQ